MKPEIHNLFQNIEKFFLTIKKNTSIKEKSCYNINDNLMLKTISYSIVFVSKFILDLERAKENNEKRKEVKSEDYIFSCVDSQIEIQKIFQKVFENEDVKVDRKSAFLSSKYVSTNNYSVSFDFPLALKLEYEKEIQNEEQQKEIEENIVKISKEIIRTIKEFNNYEDRNIIAFIENCYSLIDKKENAGKKISELLRLRDKEIENSEITIYYGDEEEKKLKLTIKERCRNEIEYSAILHIRIIRNNSINSMIDRKNKEYIIDKVNYLTAKDRLCFFCARKL